MKDKDYLKVRYLLFSYGNDLKLARRKAKISQQVLADYLGIKQPIISHIEQGLFLPLGEMREKIENFVKGWL